MDEQKPSLEEMIQAASSMILKRVLDLMYRDNHYFGDRPCETCRAASALTGFSVGCDRWRKEGRPKNG